MYLVHIYDSLLLDCYVSISRTLRPDSLPLYSYFRMLCTFRTLSLNCYVSILRSCRNIFYSIVTLVSRAVQDTPSFVSFVGISCIYRITLHSIATLASWALSRFFFIRQEI